MNEIDKLLPMHQELAQDTQRFFREKHPEIPQEIADKMAFELGDFVRQKWGGMSISFNHPEEEHGKQLQFVF